MSQSVFLYRYFNAQGELLYVGISTNPSQRRLQHMGGHWLHEAFWHCVELFPTRFIAELAEGFAIFEEDPIHNVLKRHKHTIHKGEAGDYVKSQGGFLVGEHLKWFDLNNREEAVPEWADQARGSSRIKRKVMPLPKVVDFCDI